MGQVQATSMGGAGKADSSLRSPCFGVSVVLGGRVVKLENVVAATMKHRHAPHAI